MISWVKRHRCLLLVCLFLCFLFFILWITVEATGNCTEPVQAVVLEEKKYNKKVSGSKHLLETRYDTVVSYEVDGQEYRGKLKGISRKLGVGNEVLIYYDPERMNRSNSVALPYELEQIQWQFHSWEGRISAVCISIIFIAIFLSLGNSWDKKREESKTAGQVKKTHGM